MGEELPEHLDPGCLECCKDPWARAIVKCPHVFCGSCGLFIFLLAAISGAAGMMNIADEDEAWMIIDGESTGTYKAWNDAKWQAEGRPADRDTNNQRDTERRLDDHGGGPPANAENGGWVTSMWDGEWWSLSILYKSNEDASENVFTPARLQEMCRFEHLVAKHSNTWATAYDSIMLYFYMAHFNDMAEIDGCPTLPQSAVDSQLQVMYNSVKADGSNSLLARFVQPTFADGDSGFSAYTRTTMMVMGKDKKDRDHRTEILEDVLLKDLDLSWAFLKSGFQAEDDQFQTSGPLRVRLVTAADEFDKMIQGDFVLAFGAMIIVFCIVYFHLNSSFLASVAMYQIIMSLPVGALFYRGIFMVEYFEFLHILVVYLVLGIGADDVFVLVDTFRHLSEDHKLKAGQSYSDEDLVKILKGTLTRSGQAIFNTSFTTTVAFLSTSISKVMPMKTCGYYAAICIIMNFIFTMTFTPSAVIIYHRRFESKRCCCPDPSSKPAQESGAPQVEDGRAMSKSKSGMSGCIEVFLNKFYVPMMRKKAGPVNIFALLIALVMTVVAIQGIYFSSRLTPPMKPEVWLPSNHMLQGAGQFWSDTFYEAQYEKYNIITFVWGISGVDTSDFNEYKPSEKPPKVIFSSSFDASTAEAQAEILQVCEKMRTLKCDLDGCQGYGDTLMLSSTKKAYSCFLEDMKEWRVNTQGRPANEPLPTGSAFIEELRRFTREADPEQYSSEVCEARYGTDVGFIDGRLKYVSVKVRSRMFQTTAYGSGIEVRDMLQEFVDNRQGAAPAGLKDLKFHADGRFANYDLSAELIKGLYSGIAIAGPLAFFVLLVSTGNAIVSLYAVICVGCIVLCVLGFCKSAMEWDLGIGEAVAGVIVIGYSVDYVVHLAHIYCEAAEHGHDDRDARSTFAVRNMGSTIFAGALTTAGSGVIMFLCFFTFFFKMAVLICVTIMYSFLFSMGLFVSVLFLIGPENKCGDICCCFKRERAKVAPSNEEDAEKVEKQDA